MTDDTPPKGLPPDLDLHAYRFELPESAIAQTPPATRGASRLMVLDKAGGEPVFTDFARLNEYLPPRSLLVANDARVAPARLFGRRPTGGQVECLLLTPPPLLEVQEGAAGQSADVECLLRASKKPRPGEVIDFGLGLALTVESRGEWGRSTGRLSWPTGTTLDGLLDGLGRLPLPPYIERDDHEPTRPEDAERYQTAYARADKRGALAAPTAGLHFTPELLRELEGQGHDFAQVTLYVGYGTFAPVRVRDIREHRMHAEWFELPESTAAQVRAAKQAGRPVLAVGTTSLRTLEGALALTGPNHQNQPERLAAYSGSTDIFLYPGKPVHVVDALLTNFHLPESTLLMLVSALIGRERLLDAYAQALARGFRFFSYGDAMLVR